MTNPIIEIRNYLFQNKDYFQERRNTAHSN